MHGLIGKIIAQPGKADELAEILVAGSGGMAGCLSYVVARDPTEPDAVWVTEVWVDEASHQAALGSQSAREAIARGRPLIASFASHTATQPLPGSLEPERGGAVAAAAHLERLYDHGAWADARLLAAIRSAPVAVPEALREAAHVRGAQEVWLARIEARAPSLAIWPELDVAGLASEGARLDAAWAELVAELDEDRLAQPVTSTNSRGVVSTSPVEDIALHVAAHGHYHRGKANAALRAAGATPAPLDFIYWRRQLAAETG